MKIRINKKLLKISFLILLVYIISLIFSSRTIETRTYIIETSFLIENSSINIVHISDLHGVTYGENQKLIIDKIKMQEPDLILLTGDIFDDNSSFHGTELFLSGISSIAPTYFVTGNHEYRSKRLDEVMKILELYNIKVLSDEYLNIKVNENDIILAGIGDQVKKIYKNNDYDQEYLMEKNFRELDNENKYKILLAHRPENINLYQKFSFNLILSGHTHGGQIRIPYILNGLFAPDQWFFPKYAGGIYYHENIIHIISRGLFIHPMLPRIFNPPEIVVIKLFSNK